MKKWTLAHWIGVSLCAVGAADLCAWAIAWQGAIAFLPLPDAALALLIAAPAFFYESRPKIGRIAGALLIALSLAEAVLARFTDRLDQWDAVLMPEHLALGFLLSGLILALMHGVKNKWTAWLMELACLSVILMGVFHVVDQATGLHVLNSGQFDISLMVTGACLGVLGLGVWFLIRRIPWYREFDLGRIDWKITAAGGMVLLLIAFAAAIASFVIMAEQTERIMKDSLAVSLGNRARLFQNEVKDAMQAAIGISQRSSFRNALERVAGDPESAAAQAKVLSTVTRLVDSGYAGISAAAVYDARGRKLAQAGRFVTKSEFKAPLPLAPPAVLLWDNGLVLQMKLNMTEGDSVLGVLMLDARLTEIDAILKDRTGLRDTGVALVCAAAADKLQCIRARQDYRVATAPRQRAGDPLPMNYALAGEAGVTNHYDQGGRDVVSAYGPIGAWGLGMMLKMDKAEMQQPIRARLQGMLAALAVLALVGLLLLRWQIVPMAGQLVQEVFERRRIEEELRLLQTITDAIGQAKDVHAALHAALQRICDATGWIFGQAWLISTDGARLEYSPAWYGAPELESISADLRGYVFAPKQGLPGRVWANKRAEWLREGLSANSRRVLSMRKAGLKASMGVPILAGQEVIAVLEFSTRAPREEDARLLDLATLIGAQLGNTIRRKRAEEALHEGEERYRSLVQNSVEAIYLFDPETKRVLECNDAFATLLGYPNEEALSLAIYDFVAHPRADVDAFMDNLFSASVVANSERQWRRKDGGLIDVQVNARKIRHHGRDLGFFIARDITRRKLEEKELTESKHRYQELVESMDAIVWQSDLDFRATYISPQAERILGYPAQQWLERPTFWQDQLHPDDRARTLEYCGAAARAGRNYECEYRIFAADGRVLWFRDKVTVVKQDGRPVKLRGIMLDVTKAKGIEQALQETEERYTALIQHSVEAIYFYDLETKQVLDGNPAFQRMLGYSEQEIRGLSMHDFIQHDKQSVDNFALRIMELGESFPIGERRWCTKNGETIYVQVTVGQMRQRGRMVGFAIARDVTDTKLMAQSLSDSEVRYHALIENSMEAIYLYDPETRKVLEANPAFFNLLGYTREDLGALTMYDFIKHDRSSVGSFTKALQTGKTGAIAIGERIWCGKNGIHRPMDVTAGRMHQGGRAIGFTVARDMTEQKRAQERLTYLAHYDELTGLPNRTLFNQDLRQILLEAGRRQRLAAVMFLDLDRFKTINDTLGHEMGDVLLKAVAERLHECVRRGDVIARLGGDEFTIALADLAQSDDVVHVAQKILDSFTTPFQIGGRDLFVSTSIGIALYPEDHRDVDGLLKNADVAMYRAKEQGRNNYQFYTQEMNAKAFERLTMEIQLRRALERGELLLHYQPQVNLTKGAMVGVEALIRWQNPEVGLVPPATFIPLAEETGLIVPIGEWVLRTACIQNKAWHDAGLPKLRISVNLSARQFREKNLVQTVRNVLQETGLDPRYLELELTESMLQHMDTAEAVLKELHALGVYLSVDDFGIGYSSFNYLKRFPIDTLKIDRSFIRDVIDDPDDAAITDAIIRMAHTLGMQVVAEGVETREQLAFLHQQGCDLIQGYYFSKPIPAEGFTELLRSDRRLTPSERLILPEIKTAGRESG